MPSMRLDPSNGEPFRISGADPAAGANFQVTIPSNEIWILDQISCRLATNATVANHKVVIQYEDGGGIQVEATISSVAQAASLTVDWFYAQLGEKSAALADGRGQGSLPAFVLQPGSVIFIVIIAIAAGDQITRVRYSGRKWRV